VKSVQNFFEFSRIFPVAEEIHDLPVEKNEHSAYYWLRMAEENSSAVRQRCRALTEDLRTKINPGEIEALESTVAAGASKDEILGRKPVDFFKKHLPSIFSSDRQAS